MFILIRRGAYAERSLFVDLTSGTCITRLVPDEWKRKYIGGRGYGVKVISDLLDPQIGPLSEGNILVFAPGPLTGSRIPMGSRFDVVTKSPLTGTLTSAKSGGFFGTAMKRAPLVHLPKKYGAASPSYLSTMKRGMGH